MDNFDEFLKKQARKEDEEFKLPESFNKRVEDVLKNLDNKEIKKDKTKEKKRFIIAAASLAFILVAGKVVMDMNNKVLNENTAFDIAKSIDYSGSTDNSKSSPRMESSYDGYVEESDMADKAMENSIETVINDNVEYIIYNNEEISDENKVNEIVSYINSMNLEKCGKQEISNWAISMEVIGNNHYVVKITDEYISINNEFYRCNESEIKELTNIIEG